MTDEFNLVPTNNLEKHLDNILRAASGDEPQYDLAPNWRVEQYLAAIAAKLSGGGMMVVNSVYDETTEKYVLDKTWNEINNAMRAGTFVFVLQAEEGNVTTVAISTCFIDADTTFYVTTGEEGTANYTEYEADSASGYPSVVVV